MALTNAERQRRWREKHTKDGTYKDPTHAERQRRYRAKRESLRHLKPKSDITTMLEEHKNDPAWASLINTLRNIIGNVQ